MEEMPTERIPIINIESGDPRLKFLKNVFREEIRTPCLIINKSGASYDFGTYVKDDVNDVFVFSVIDREHMYYLLKNLVN